MQPIVQLWTNPTQTSTVVGVPGLVLALTTVVYVERILFCLFKWHFFLPRLTRPVVRQRSKPIFARTFLWYIRRLSQRFCK